MDEARLFLILHKVRGEPAFDIATRLQIGAEEGWIIPTSGHRAYPYQWWNLDDLVDGSDINRDGFHERPSENHTIPSDWPDHYRAAEGYAPRAEPTSKGRVTVEGTIQDLKALFGPEGLP
jgi:hypothetical protein